LWKSVEVSEVFAASIIKVTNKPKAAYIAPMTDRKHLSNVGKLLPDDPVQQHR
jgi:hypothetical protein